MDSVTHALVGVLMGMAFTAVPQLNENPALTVAIGALASSLPDIDTVTKMFSSKKYLEVHRRFTHQIHVLPILAFIVPLVFFSFTSSNFWMYYLLSICAIFSHLFLDSLNPYGTKIIPFYRHIKLNILSTVDPLIIALLIVNIFAVYYTKSSYALLMFPIYLLLRILFFFTIKRLIKRSDSKIIKVSPISTYNPLKWHVIVEYPDHFKVGSYYRRLFNIDFIEKKRLPELYQQKINMSKEFKIFKELAFAYNPTVEDNGEYVVCKFVDIKYRKKDYYYFQLLFYFKNDEIQKAYLGFVFSDNKAKKMIERGKDYAEK